MHKKENVKTNFGNKGAYVSSYLRAVESTSANELKKRKAQFASCGATPAAGKKFQKYMDEDDDCDLYAFAHKAKTGATLHGRRTQGACESMNNAIKDSRKMAPVTMLNNISNADRLRALRAKQAAQEFDGSMPPQVRVSIYGTKSEEGSTKWQHDLVRREDSKQWLRCSMRKTVQHHYTYPQSTGSHVSQGVVVVKRPEYKSASGRITQAATTARLEVDLDNHTCECGYWALNDCPCSHALGLCDHLGWQVEDILSKWQTVACWKAQWAFTPVAAAISDAVWDGPRSPLLEAVAKAPSGAPKKHKRMPSVAADYVQLQCKRLQSDKTTYARRWYADAAAPDGVWF
jgi:hypothetical protein